ncbi:hypothetical protein NMY22_g11371 [Coprinellus aureogranulatus]|nr:hypothetical protein NMY22_g11371 [Coprinellus aureogranulatus]
MSAAPSLAHTILSLFEQEDDEDTTRGPIHLPEDGLEEGHMHSFTEDHDGESLDLPRRNAPGFTTVAGWKQYFVPLARPMFYRSLAHLLFINFPYALAAWVYLFVFTVSGSVLLIALPLGRPTMLPGPPGRQSIRSRRTLPPNYIPQSTLIPIAIPSSTDFHALSRSHQPRDRIWLFGFWEDWTRSRTLFLQEHLRYGESFSLFTLSTTHPVFTPISIQSQSQFVRISLYCAAHESYSRLTPQNPQFTDPTSYQALFYFIVIKPAITIILLLFVLIFVIPSIILVLPAPAALRATRKLGRWQANIAVEGLYHAVRYTLPPQASAHMSKYALPDVVYRGYIMPPDKFTEMMNQIPEYKWVYDNAGYDYDDHIYRYVYWKKGELKEDLRIRAPRIKEHREAGVSLSNPPTHIMILTSYIKCRRPDLVKEPKKLLETENDRKSIEATVKFFRSQGAKDVKVEDFQYTYSVGCNPKLTTT